MRHKLTIFNKSLYKEIEIPRNAKFLKIGTEPGNDFPLNREDFFESIQIILVNKNNAWQLICNENLYISGDVTKLMVKTMEHKTQFDVCYKSGQHAFTVKFEINFAAENYDFNRVIDISSRQIFTIGSHENSSIVLLSPYTKGINATFQSSLEGLIFKTITGGSLYINDIEVSEGTTIRDSDFFSIEDCFFYYKNKIIWAANNEDINSKLPVKILSALNEYPKFTRNTRIKTVVNDDPIEILDPPNKPEKPRNNLVTRLLPSVGMLIAAGFMVKMGGYMIAFSLISATLGIVTTVVTLIDDRRNFKKKSKERIKKYKAYIANKETEIQNARETEKEDLEEIYITQQDELERVRSFSPDLFDKNKKDEDFLCVRLGTGDIKAKRIINYKKQERLETDDDLQQMPESLSKTYEFVEDAPVTCNLRENTIGVYGSDSFRFTFYKMILMDIVTRHYHSDVKIAVVAKEHIDWLEDIRLLPHLSIHGQRNIACDEDSKNQLFEYLYSEIINRTARKEYDYNIVVFIVDEFGFKNHPVSKFVNNNIGITFIFFEELREKLPQGCSHIIAPDEDGAKLIAAENKDDIISFKYPDISNEQIKFVVKTLAPVYSEDLSLENGLMKNISLYDLLEIYSADDIDLKKRWDSSEAVKSLKAPIGISNKGIVSLDLSDKADGPHGLVAGTTGSGKSELILTYVLSMSTLYSPHEVGFVIIDFKGGGMANQLEDLPHLIGTITNIDGKEIDRSLRSIRAELQKRQILFAKEKVNHIDSYILKYKNGEAKIPLPHLIIIVDEFAELKAEQPEFMKELISAARIGRSLGVHLILATQKPAGQVNDQIWSNSRFKLCLKVQNVEDSKEVLKSPLAAEIKESGRAYLQIGNNEVFELFQSGYSGAPDKISRIKEFSIYEIKKNGQKVLAYARRKPKSNSDKTQLKAVVEHINKFAADNGVEKLPPICMPPLPNKIAFSKSQNHDDIGVIADIGVYDNPDNQTQDPYSINLTRENLMIIGSSQSGKTNLLQTIIRSITSSYSSKEVNLYILDFGSMFLKTYEKLKHVGGIAVPSDDEKLRNLMKLLRTEMAERKEKLLETGVSSYAAYLEAGKDELPQIVIFIDNLTALREMYFEDDDDELLSICRDGQSLGISVIITNPSTSGFGYKYLSCFTRKMAFYNNDPSEYSNIFNHCRETLSDIQGRCLIEVENTIHECQTFLAFAGKREIDKSEYIQSYIEGENAKNQYQAKRIPEVPDVVTDAYIENNYKYKAERFSVLLGLSYNSVSPVVLSLANLGSPLTFVGDMGKIECLKHLIASLNGRWPGLSKIYITDNMNKELSEFKDVTEYSIIAEQAVSHIKEIEKIAAERYRILSKGADLDLSKEPLLLLVLNNFDSLESISSDADAMKAYKNLTTKYKAMNVCIIVSQYNNAVVSFSAPEMVRLVRESEHFLLFDDLNAIKMTDIPFGYLQNNKKKLIYSEAYYLKDSEIDKVKCII